MAFLGWGGPWEVFVASSWPLVRMTLDVLKLMEGVGGLISQVAYSHTHSALPTEGLSYSLKMLRFHNLPP
jgi:hypothetical protein